MNLPFSSAVVEVLCRQAELTLFCSELVKRNPFAAGCSSALIYPDILLSVNLGKHNLSVNFDKRAIFD